MCPVHLGLRVEKHCFSPPEAGNAAATPSALLASDSIKPCVNQRRGTVSTPCSAVAKTQYGPVRGFFAGGVFTFKGVPYGQNTGGENRWLPSQECSVGS